MTPTALRFFACLLCIVLFARSPVAAQEFDAVIHVDIQHRVASDGNSGTEARPLRTVQAAVSRAVINKRQNRSTRIVIHPGTYREFVNMETWTNYPSNDPANRTPIVVEASEPGTVILSGSDVWTGWQREGNYYTQTWLMNWGISKNHTRGAREVEPIVRRREMIFVDGKWMRPVLSKKELTPGSFFVDERGDKVYLYPENGTEIADATVEVAVRPRVWSQAYEHNVTLRGLIFQHANEPWTDLPGSARFTASNGLLIEDCELRWNNYIALELVELDGATVRRTTMNHNGADGWGMFKVRNVYAEDTETSYNNWRGDLGGFYSWSVGNKILRAHGLTIKRHRATGNLSRGLWIDYDNQDVLLDSLYMSGNRLDGVRFEANQGPVEMRNSTIVGNGDGGMRISHTEKMRLINNRIENNEGSQLIIFGGGKFGEAARLVSDHVSNRDLQIRLRDWVLEKNVVAGGDRLLEGLYFSKDEWELLRSTIRADGNVWRHGTNERPFEVLKRKLTFADWQRAVGERNVRYNEQLVQ